MLSVNSLKVLTVGAVYVPSPRTPELKADVLKGHPSSGVTTTHGCVT
jgi:hypothetical protein